MTPSSELYAPLRNAWLWWIMSAMDTVDSLRTAAIVSASAGNPKAAADLLGQADLIAQEGPSADGKSSLAMNESEAKAAYKALTGFDIDDPEVKKRMNAAPAALARADRERADAAAVAAEAAKARAARSKTARRGRRTS